MKIDDTCRNRSCEFFNDEIQTLSQLGDCVFILSVVIGLILHVFHSEYMRLFNFVDQISVQVSYIVGLVSKPSSQMEET